MISFGLEEEQQLARETVRKLATEVLRPRMRDTEKARAVPDALRRDAHELGVATMDLPEPLGGQGATLVTAAIVHEELAYGDPGLAVALASPVAAAQAICALGDEAQRQRWVPRFTAADGWTRRGAIAYCERSDGAVAPDRFATTARADGADYVIDGKKAWVVDGGVAELVVVFAQLGDEPAAFVVERGNAGMTVGARHETLGVDVVEAHELTFAGCRVPGDARLFGDGNLVAATARLFARLGLLNAARQVGLARAAYDFALEYTQERKAFGKPVAHFQAIAFTLADMHTDVEAARWMVWRAAVELERGELANVWSAIAHANEAAWRNADHGVQLLGGAGFIRDYPVEKWLRDTKALALHAPPSEALELEAAGAMLGHTVGSALPSPWVQPFFT
jgi:acyl-CoA dehydrogenase